MPLSTCCPFPCQKWTSLQATPPSQSTQNPSSFPPSLQPQNPTQPAAKAHPQMPARQRTNSSRYQSEGELSAELAISRLQARKKSSAGLQQVRTGIALGYGQSRVFRGSEISTGQMVRLYPRMDADFDWLITEERGRQITTLAIQNRLIARTSSPRCYSSSSLPDRLTANTTTNSDIWTRVMNSWYSKQACLQCSSRSPLTVMNYRCLCYFQQTRLSRHMGRPIPKATASITTAARSPTYSYPLRMPDSGMPITALFTRYPCCAAMALKMRSYSSTKPYDTLSSGNREVFLREGMSLVSPLLRWYSGILWSFTDIVKWPRRCTLTTPSASLPTPSTSPSSTPPPAISPSASTTYRRPSADTLKM